MYRGRAAGPVIAVMALALAGGSGAAQSVTRDERIRQHAERALELRSDYARALERYRARQARDRARRDRPTGPVLDVGPFQVQVMRGEPDFVRGIFEDVWREVEPLLGDLTPPELAGHLFVVRHPRGGERLRLESHMELVELSPHRSPAELRRIVARRVNDLLPGISRLAGVHLDLSRPEDLGAVHRALLLDNSKASRACVAGELDACWTVNGFFYQDSGPNVADLRYTQDEQRARVATLRVSDRARPDQGACVLRDDIEACRRVLQLYGSVFAPFATAGPRSLVRVALDLGGARSLARWAESGTGRLHRRGDVERALTQTAGVDAHEVMAEWRRRVLAARPDRAPGTRQHRAPTIASILILLALSTRSTRWRLG